MTTTLARPEAEYKSNYPLDEAQIKSWIETFDRDGVVFLPEFLPRFWCEEMHADLIRALVMKRPRDHRGAMLEIAHRLFEVSAANLKLFDVEPMVTFAESILSAECHVTHNNSFLSPINGGGIASWHQDDAPHFLVTEGEAPSNIKLPCLLFTANYYLTDVPALENGPFQYVPGSHLFGKACPTDLTGTPYESKIVTCLGKAGSVMMFNNQVWHRGAPCTGATPRAITQTSFGRRLMGHMYYPFMNYQMPEHCYKDANPRLKRLLGFKNSGAYG